MSHKTRLQAGGDDNVGLRVCKLIKLEVPVPLVPLLLVLEWKIKAGRRAECVCACLCVGLICATSAQPTEGPLTPLLSPSPRPLPAPPEVGHVSR